MKNLLMFCLIIPCSLWANETFICSNTDVELRIEILNTKPKKVSWAIMLKGDESSAINGMGLWQKETESPDAFSSFDEMSAISYKNQHAVFAIAEQVVYFPLCHLQ